MKLQLQGGGLWDGVQLEAEVAPEEIRLRALDGGKTEAGVSSAERETVDLSKMKEHIYLLDSIDENRQAIYKFCLP